MNEVINAIKSRRSVRAYKSDALSRETLGTIVGAGYYAPTGCNEQPWHFSVIQDRALLEEVNVKAKEKMRAIPVDWIKKAGENPNSDITHKAPVMIIVSLGENPASGEVDCTAALENMLLAAESLGIGSCWMGLVNLAFGDTDLMKKLGVPDGYKPQQAAVFGYPSGNKPKAPERKQDVVTYVGKFD